VHRLVRDDKNAAARCPLDAPGYPLTTTGPIWGSQMKTDGFTCVMINRVLSRRSEADSEPRIAGSPAALCCWERVA
jgi:hypothetical protein